MASMTGERMSLCTTSGSVFPRHARRGDWPSNPCRINSPDTPLDTNGCVHQLFFVPFFFPPVFFSFFINDLNGLITPFRHLFG